MNQKNAFDAKIVQGYVCRLIAPELRAFGAQLLQGEVDLDKSLSPIYAKLSDLTSAVLIQGAPKSLADLAKLAPLPQRKGSFKRLPDTVVRAILTLRKGGKSRRQIAQALKKPTATIHAVLRREGDPAPADMIARDLALKERTIARLQAQVDAQRRKAS